MNNIIDTIGKYNPYILVILSIILFYVYDDMKMIVYFIVGYILCIIVNKILKYTIKDERPYWNAEKSLYNMPSGHCMAVFYSITFMYLYFQDNMINNNIVFIYFILGLVTIYNCIEGNYHTMDQTIIGTICGIIFTYYYYKNIN
jgi:membrane-associated phospholipid phosphatase